MKRVLVVILLAALAACGGKKSPPPPPVTSADAAAPALDAAVLDSPAALWRAYQAAHAGATKANAAEVGQTIDALLSKEARDIITAAAAQMTASLSTPSPISPIELRYRVLGEGAAAREAMIGRATIEVAADNTIIARDGAKTLQFTAVSEDGGWRLAPSPDLLVKGDDLFQLPAGSAQTVGATSAEAITAQWVTALNRGTGWDAYNLVAPSSRATLKAMVAQMGGSGDEDVVRILEKTIRDRRDRGITAVAPTLEPGDGDRRPVTFHYSDGGSDRFEAAREDGAWWIVLPL